MNINHKVCNKCNLTFWVTKRDTCYYCNSILELLPQQPTNQDNIKMTHREWIIATNDLSILFHLPLHLQPNTRYGIMGRKHFEESEHNV